MCFLLCNVVHVHLCDCECIYVQVTCVWIPKVGVDISLHCSPLHFLRLGLLLNLEPSDSTSQGSQLATGIPLSDSRTLELQVGYHICPAFYVGSGHQDSDLHVYLRQALYPQHLQSAPIPI